MATTWTLFVRECRAYLNSPVAYVFLILFVLVSGMLFLDFGSFLTEGLADMRGFFGFVPWILLVFIPAIAMRLWAEEKKVGTIELLMTLPVRDAEAVLAKYFASFLILVLALAMTFPIPYVLTKLADPKTGVDWGPIICGYLGVLLMGGAYLAIGMFLSSLTKNQILAFILGVVAGFLLFLGGLPAVLQVLPSWLMPVVSALGFTTHLENLARGVVDSRNILYFVSVIALFIFLTVRSIESRNWR